MGVFLLLIFVIQLAFSIVASVPVTEKPVNTFYNAVVEKCPLIKNVPNFKDQKIFTKCTDWKKINETNSLTEDTQNEYLCLLYFDSLGIFCSEIKQLATLRQLVNVTYFTPSLDNFSLDTICKNLSILPKDKKYEHNIVQWMKDEKQCIKLCGTFDLTAKPECSLSYFYANTKFVPKEQNSSTEKEPKKEIEEKDHPNAVNPSQGQPNASESQGQGQYDVSKNVPSPTKKDAVNSQPLVVAGQQTAREPSKKDKNDENSVVNNEEAAGDKPKTGEQQVPRVPSDQQTPHQQVPTDQQVPHTVHVNTSVQQMPNAVPDHSQPSTEGKVTTENKHTELDQETAQAKDKTDDDIGVNDSMDVKPPAQDTNLENPDENFPDDMGDLEEEEKEQGKLDDAPENNNNDQDLKIEDRPQDLPNQELKKESNSVVMETDNIPISSVNAGEIDGESYFFSYFMAICVLFVLGYVGYHNKQKVMALVVEGKRGKRQYRGRRPNSANYHKLDSNLEEAISSSVNKNSSHVIY